LSLLVERDIDISDTAVGCKVKLL